ncbi:MAG: Uma2 family endonuclease [Geobacteraceae bacterium]|nr:Uma2 family endonuclease [Geobacteraceae bacterium]
MGSTAEKRKFTYADYKSWPDEERWEIIDGEAYNMTPAPSLKHQRVLGNIHAIFFDYFKNKQCRPYLAPTDVVLDDFNVVQPDLLVVCDTNKLTEANIQGAPDLVVEILSPSTKLKDKREKKALYERFGVREYLVVYPEDEMVEQYRLVDGRYASDVFNWDQKLPLFAFPDLELQLWNVFEKGMAESR